MADELLKLFSGLVQGYGQGQQMKQKNELMEAQKKALKANLAGRRGPRSSGVPGLQTFARNRCASIAKQLAGRSRGVKPRGRNLFRKRPTGLRDDLHGHWWERGQELGAQVGLYPTYERKAGAIHVHLELYELLSGGYEPGKAKFDARGWEPIRDEASIDHALGTAIREALEDLLLPSILNNTPGSPILPSSTL